MNDPDANVAGSRTRVADYALLSDCQGAALVSREGSIDWACLPRFDSPAVFAGLLGTGAGHWRVGPRDPVAVERAYLPDTMVLRTTVRSAGGVVTVTDAMALGPHEHGHAIGTASPHVLARRIDGIEGTVPVEFELSARPEYGLTAPLLVPDGSGFRTRGGPSSYVLSTGVPVQLDGSDCTATVDVAAGDTLYFAFALGSPWDDDTTRQLTQSEIAELLDRTIAAWQSWSGLHQTYDGPYAQLVRHSGRVLQALSYAPTGAVIAAPTTSLPETPGGPRNWDYRFCWVRDASLTLEALWVAACPDEAEKFFRFLATAAGGHLRSSGALQILYGVGGERLVAEHELEHLDGFLDSRPVRIGNGAWNQAQLDVYGELLSAACLLATTVGSFDDISRGGVRCAQVDVPRATYCPNPRNADGTPAFGVVGSEEPLPKERLHAWYKDHSDYVHRFNRSLDELIAAGWLLPLRCMIRAFDFRRSSRLSAKAVGRLRSSPRHRSAVVEGADQPVVVRHTCLTAPVHCASWTERP
ncbi:MAG: glycoside hydrolase family 15 protein [Acidimicrobiia bacterium]